MRLFLISLISVLSLISCDVIEIGFHKERTHLYTMLSMGTPPQPFRVLVDLSSFHLWLGNKTVSKTLGHVYDGQISSTYEETNEQGVITTNQKGNEVLDLISLGFRPDMESPTLSNKKFHFLLLNKVEPGPRGEGVLGLARSYPGKIKWGKRNVDANPRFSLLHYLSTNKAIDHKSFSIKYLATDRGVIKFGDRENSFPSCKPNENEKNANGIYLRWNCPYYGMVLSNGTYIYNFGEDAPQTVQFETVLDIVQLPEGPARQLFVALQDFLGIECRTLLLRGKGKTMFCNSAMDIDRIPDFTLKVKGFDMTLPGKEFFEPYFDETIGKNGEHGYISKIFGNKNTNRVMRLGNCFLKYYKFVFDQETGSVSLGDFNDIFPKGTEGGNQRRFGPGGWRRRGFSGFSVFLIVVGVVLVMFGGFLLYRKRMLKRRKNFAEKSRIVSTKETFIEPIGKPMVDK